MSAVVQRFLSSSSASHPDRAVVCATIDDAPHFSEADKARIVASYAPHDDLMSATRYAIMMLRYAKTDIPPKPRSIPRFRGGWMAA